MDLANKSTDQYEYSKSYSAPCEDPRPLPLPHQTTYLLSFTESAPPPRKNLVRDAPQPKILANTPKAE